MTVQFITTVLVVTATMVFAPAAHADDQAPPTPWQVPTSGGVVIGGVQTYPPVCLTSPLACGFRYDIARGVWGPAG